MEVFYESQVLWSQIDANQHLRHSAYADFAAQARVAMLDQSGLSTKVLFQHKIGPVLFREELVYLREITINDFIKVACEITRSRVDGSRWTIRHEIFRGDGVKAAVIIADGAWIDMEKRKLTALPTHLIKYLDKVPKSADYVEDIPKVKL